MGLQSTLATALADRYSANVARIRELAGSLSEAQFWEKPLPYGNSFGHLVLHLTGNLNYYVGAQIANTGYVRERPREFTESNPPSKEVAIEKLEKTVATVVKTIQTQSEDDWGTEYQALGTNCRNRLDMMIQCAAHMQHHIGQMIYLCQEWQRQGKATSPEQSVT